MALRSAGESSSVRAAARTTKASRGAARIVTSRSEDAVRIDAAPYSAGGITCEMKGSRSSGMPRCRPPSTT